MSRFFWELIYSMLSWYAPAVLRNSTIYIMSRLNNYDLRKIIQPHRVFNKFHSKRCWDSCTAVISSKNMAEMPDDVIDELFIWLQDMNWPGADNIYDYFLSSPCDRWIKNFEKSVREARNEDDNEWLTSLHNLVSEEGGYGKKGLNLKKEAFTDAEIFDFIINYSYDE